MNGSSPLLRAFSMCGVFFAVCVAYWLCVSVLPAAGILPSWSAPAPDTRWYADTVAANPGAETFYISTAEELAGFAAIVNGTWGGDPGIYDFKDKIIKLTADIDLSGYRNWVPIGAADSSGAANCFSGWFNGEGHVISNLTINRPRKNMQGLFGLIYRGRAGNFGLVNVKVRGRDNVGAVAGQLNAGSHVVKCYSAGTVKGAEYAGGLVGSLANGSSLTDSYTFAAVSGSDYVGGAAGSAYRSRVSYNYTAGAVKSNEVAGGVVGSVGDQSTVAGNAALNPEVMGRSWSAGRVAGRLGDGGIISNNAAFDKMKKVESAGSWGDKGPATRDGEDYSAADINASPTLGGRFRHSRGWAAAPGKLPGLHGNAVDMPQRLQTGAPPPDTVPFAPAPQVAKDTFADQRDGKTYATVNVAGKTWMAENLNFARDSSWCYIHADTNCAKFGRLYNWKAAMAACPPQWRLPDTADWNSLAEAAGGAETGGKKLKSASGWEGREDQDGYYTPGDGTDELGFSALPGGYRLTDGRFIYGRGHGTVWWSSSEVASVSGVWVRSVIYGSDEVLLGLFDKSNGYAVRCVREGI